MKKLYCLIILVLTCRICNSQSLVPNGDFEQFTSCPGGQGEIYLCQFWMNPSSGPIATTGSPDYYNQCATSSSFSVPSNWIGFQNAHSNSAYCGGYLWIGSVADAREYIEVPFTSTLAAGQCYHFEMYVNLGDGCAYTTGDIGAYFSDTAVTGIPNYFPLPFTPQISNPTANVFDTLNWTLVSGDFTAQGTENYLIIGNFKDDASTSVISASGVQTFVYAYFEDVSLTPCTGLETHDNHEQVKIYPNPANAKLNLFLKYRAEIIISDTLGEIVLHKEGEGKVELDISSLSPGIYFIKTGSEVRKFVKE